LTTFHVEPRPDDIGPRLDRLAELIAGSVHNLVSRRDRDAVRSAHVSECLGVASLLSVAPGDAWLDLGTGGGLPGLVLAMVFPDSRWTLVDATRKKVDAVAEFARILMLRNVTVRHGRAETLAHVPDLRERFEGVVSRAVAPLPTLLELSRGFVHQGGVVAAVKGTTWQEEVRTASRARELLRLGRPQTDVVTSAVRPTWLVSMRATGPAPAAYPRRDGLPRTQPLGVAPRP